MILTGSVVISGGSTNGTVQGEGGPINLINRIKIQCNRAAGSRYPGGLLVDCTPQSLLRYATIEHQGKFIGELSASTLGNGAAGTYLIYLSIPIYFADSRTVESDANRSQCRLAGLDRRADLYGDPGQSRSRGAQNLQNCFAGNDRTLNMTGCTIQWVDDRLGLTSDTIPMVQEDHDLLITAAQTRLVDPGMPQDGSFTSWLVLAKQSVNQNLADTLLNRVTVVAPTLSLDQYAQDIRQQMYDDGWFDPSQSGVGQFFMDFTNGLLQNSNPSAGIAAKFDVNNLEWRGSRQIDVLHQACVLAARCLKVRRETAGNPRGRTCRMVPLENE